MYEDSSINLTPFPIMVCNKDGCILYVNSNFQNEFDIANSKLSGALAHTCFQIFKDRDNNSHSQFQQQLTSQCNFFSFLSLNGKNICVNVSINKSPLNRDDYWLIISRCRECSVKKYRTNNKLDRINHAIKGASIGLWELEPLQNQSYFSSTFKQLLGLGLEFELNWFSFLSMLPPQEQNKLDTFQNHKLDIGESFDIEIQMKVGEDDKWFKLNGEVILKQNNHTSITGSLIDCTLEKARLLTLQKANLELKSSAKQRSLEFKSAKEFAKKASQTQSEFLSMMNHELRTPMNAVIGSLDLLRLSKQSSESMELIETATSSATNLMNILNDILDINKIESGKMQLEHSPFSINETIDGLVKSFLPSAQKKQIQLNIKESSMVPSQVIGDEKKTRRVLYNLISNAIKFTDLKCTQGRVNLNCEVSQQSEELLYIKLTIEDNGIGINESDQSKLFAPFTQAQKSVTREYGGTGLGLPICRSLVQQMGGKITLTSKEGVGSTFTVELPFSLIETEQVQPKLNTYNIGVITQGQNLELGKTIIKQLESEGARVKSVNIEELDIALINYDLLLLIPDSLSNSQTLLQQLYQKQEQARKFLIAIPRGELPQARKLIPHKHILPVEPMTKIQLLESVKSVIEEQELNLDLELELGLNELTFDDIEIDLKSNQIPTTLADILVVEDNPLNQKLIVKQLSKLGYQCDLADDGIGGIENWKNMDYKLILTDCHMPNLDGYSMTKQIRELEEKSDKKKVPIIAITGAAMSGDAERCYSMGMNDFVSKPIILKDLKKVMDIWYEKAT
ncbi:ATP-binding protein [Shewanella woodyi]|uniref:histidine kinase n=1 Tax=Shewanella woodyi (strain ATCC 51908 / MS32) TaxID=392500 RepID=B1KGK2_SHEWM|nr:ATP-binding protein [Shewanella woodyi]ACA85330.1 PAS/PAC sensor hybrid histidine kinase [Shewanella woodyi ATCC 51908]